MPNPLIGRTLPSHPNRPRCRPRLVLLAASGLAGLLAGAPAARAALILSGNSTGSTLSNCVNVTGTPCGSTGTVTSLGLDSFTLSISTALNPFNVIDPAHHDNRGRPGGTRNGDRQRSQRLGQF